ncbi:MAG: CsbD family protein [Actinomycetota bacterium]|nr:CsbD family protein [Actinomycetota bacterium]
MKEGVGDATDDVRLEQEGREDQAKGKAKQAVGHAKDAAEDLKEGIKDTMK